MVEFFFFHCYFLSAFQYLQATDNFADEYERVAESDNFSLRDFAMAKTPMQSTPLLIKCYNHLH